MFTRKETQMFTAQVMKYCREQPVTDISALIECIKLARIVRQAAISAAEDGIPYYVFNYHPDWTYANYSTAIGFGKTLIYEALPDGTIIRLVEPRGDADQIFPLFKKQCTIKVFGKAKTE